MINNLHYNKLSYNKPNEKLTVINNGKTFEWLLPNPLRFSNCFIHNNFNKNYIKFKKL